MSFIDWRDLFDELFEDFSHNWTLTCVQRSNTRQLQKLQKCRQMERTGYAKFHCPKCSNSWASAKALVILYYPNSNQPLGNVTMRLFGQQCKKCSGNKSYFVDPEFEDDGIKLVLNKLHEKIDFYCYGKPVLRKTKTNKDSKHSFKGPHEKELCEACQSGHCDQVSTNK